MLWSNSNREKTKTEHPDWKLPELSKHFGEHWKSVGGEEKEKWEAKAAEDKLRHQREHAAWAKDHPDEAEKEKQKKGSGGKKKKEKDPNAPKRATTAYFYFLKDSREKFKAKHPTAKMAELSKIMGEEWAKISDTDKQKYKDLAAKDKERYEREKASAPAAASSSSSAPKKSSSKKAAEPEAEDSGGDDDEGGSGEDDGSAGDE